MLPALARLYRSRVVSGRAFLLGRTAVEAMGELETKTGMNTIPQQWSEHGVRMEK